jgi:hypothetical protein
MVPGARLLDGHQLMGGGRSSAAGLVTECSAHHLRTLPSPLWFSTSSRSSIGTDALFSPVFFLRRANAQPRSGGIFIAWGVSPRTRQTKNTQSREAAADPFVCRRFAAGLYAECPPWGWRPRLCICRASGACRKSSFLSAAESNCAGGMPARICGAGCLSRRSRIPAACTRDACATRPPGRFVAQASRLHVRAGRPHHKDPVRLHIEVCGAVLPVTA